MANRRILRYNPRMVYLTTCVADYLLDLEPRVKPGVVPAASPADMTAALERWWVDHKGSPPPYTGRALSTQLGRAAHITKLLVAVGARGAKRVWLHVQHATNPALTGSAMDGLFAAAQIDPNAIYRLTYEQYAQIFDAADAVPAAEVEKALHARGIMRPNGHGRVTERVIEPAPEDEEFEDEGFEDGDEPEDDEHTLGPAPLHARARHEVA